MPGIRIVIRVCQWREKSKRAQRACRGEGEKSGKLVRKVESETDAVGNKTREREIQRERI